MKARKRSAAAGTDRGNKARLEELERRIAVLGRCQATLDLDPDGTIVDASVCFLELTGYALKELVGRHHSLFISPEERRGPEYLDLWQRLTAGHVVSREHAWLRKDGGWAWLQSRYAPLPDGEGRCIRVIQSAADATRQHSAGQQMKDVLRDATRVLRAMAAGKLNERMTGKYSGDFVALTEAVHGCVARLGDMIGRISGVSTVIAASTAEIVQGNSTLHQAAEEQAWSLDEGVCSLEELSGTVRETADQARAGHRYAEDARELVEKAEDAADTAVSAMLEVNRMGRKLSETVAILDDIATQTRLLALNAAMESARAGEDARCFAVVAAEVRALAERSAGAARELRTLVGESVEKLEEGARVVNTSAMTMDQVAAAVDKVSGIMAGLAAASEQQSAGVAQLNRALLELDELNHENATAIGEASGASSTMDAQSRLLAEWVGFFSGTEPGPVRPAQSTEGASIHLLQDRRSSERPWSDSKPRNTRPLS